MKHNILCQALAGIVLFLGTGGCTVESLHTGEEGEGLKITISCGPETKVTQDGVGNENLIKTVDVFLFHNTAEKYTHRFHEKPDVNTNYTMYVGSSFATESEYTIFTIVNYPYTDLSDLDTDFGTNGDAASRKTLAELKAIALSESSNHTFTKGAAAPYSLADEGDLSLVMTGQADNVAISTSSGTNVIGTANIDVKRLAAKVTMDFYLQDELVNDVNGDGSVIETWTPITDGNAIRAYLCNGNQSIQIGGTGAASLFDYNPDTNMKSITGKSGFTAAYSMPAFYSYPESWTKGEANEPFIKLIVQWKLSRTTAGGTFTSQKETYYKVMLPTAVDAFAANTWYDFKLDVTQLGATSESDAVPVVPSYQVADWGSENILISTLVPSYYLSVSEENKNLKFYTDKVEIPFTSSGNVSFSTSSPVDIYSEDFSDGSVHHYINGTVKWVSIDNVNNIVTINRPIVSNFPDEYDVSPYTFEITLHLDDDGVNTRYDQVITAIQYPPLFIKGEYTGPASNSTYTVHVNNTSAYSGNYYNAWDNASSRPEHVTTENHSRYLGNLYKPETVAGAATNNNLNLYTVTATNISLLVEYDGEIVDAVIGDPRAAATNEYNMLTGGGTALTNYRPTAENTKNVIAPQFLVASSLGKTIVMSYEGAVKRCASYQEYGYPAGRWRVPTIAEIEFMLELDRDGKIPSLFMVDANATRRQTYWTAGKEVYSDLGFLDLSTGATLGVAESGGYYYVQYTKSSVSDVPIRGSVRCVYDTWYWGENHSATTNSWLGYKPNLNDTF